MPFRPIESVTVVLLVVVVAGSVSAQSQPRQMFDRWDKNKAGKLVREELPAEIRPNFDKADIDGDGFISIREHAEYLQRGSRRGASVQGNVEVKRDLSYVPDGHERHKLDLYLPKAKDQQPDVPASKRPLVIWIHGGAWRAGSKNGCPAGPLVERGFVVASINYRLSNHAVFPAQIHDCKAAIRWLRANADEYGIDAEKVGVWGSSAGGHLVALLGTSGDVKDLEGDLGNLDQSSRVQAVCDWFGPTDLLLMNQQAGEFGTMDHDAPNSPESQLLGGTLQQVPDKAKRASPLTYVTSDDPPFLIVHGDQDPLVPWQQSQMLTDSLKAAKCKVTFTIVSGAGHGRFKEPQVTEDSLKFFEDALE
jgi:acetyl esterase/lipase